jgi:hypothetical protein
MCRVLALGLSVFVSVSAGAQEPVDGGASLEERVRELEAKLGKLEQAAPPPAEAPVDALDVKEPPFSKFDWSWLNGSNAQPASLLRIGPVTPSVFVDVDLAWQFSRPIDHTIFPTTTAARHGEFNLNLAYVGFELNGLDSRSGAPIGRVELQTGSYVSTIQGQDSTSARGFFISTSVLGFVKQAGAGWHFHALHGVNVEVGIFPSYIALESYVPQENWNYTHPFVSDFTPYYFAGLRSQLYLREDLKVELWLVNGWQSFARWHDAVAGGYLVNWRPTSRLSLTHVLYGGQDQPRLADPLNQSFRLYTDNYAQWLLFEDLGRDVFQRLALCLVADLGYEDRGPKAGAPAADGSATPPSGVLGGTSLTLRAEWTRQLASTVRGDLFYDHGGAVVSGLPLGSPYMLPGNGSATNPFEWLGGGVAGTFDWRPSPWLLFRLEYSHRWANQPYFSGHGGITGPNGVPATTSAERDAFTPDLRRSDDRVIANLTLRL